MDGNMRIDLIIHILEPLILSIRHLWNHILPGLRDITRKILRNLCRVIAANKMSNWSNDIERVSHTAYDFIHFIDEVTWQKHRVVALLNPYRGSCMDLSEKITEQLLEAYATIFHAHTHISSSLYTCDVVQIFTEERISRSWEREITNSVASGFNVCSSFFVQEFWCCDIIENPARIFQFLLILTWQDIPKISPLNRAAWLTWNNFVAFYDIAMRLEPLIKNFLKLVVIIIPFFGGNVRGAFIHINGICVPQIRKASSYRWNHERELAWVNAKLLL